MRRGQAFRPNDHDPDAFSKQQLLDAAGMSPKTFDAIRKAARVRGPGHGGLNWMFNRAEIDAIIRKAESGKFTEKGGPAAEAWRQLLLNGVPPETEDEQE